MNILLSTIGRRTYIVDYFKEALKGKGKVYASNNRLTYTLLQADKYTITPNISDTNYIPFIINYCKKENINAVISFFDIDIYVLSKNRFLLESNNIKLIISDFSVVETCDDKWKSYQFLKSLNLSQPKTYVDKNEMVKALRNNIIKFPIIIKPRWGIGSIGIYKIYDTEELNVLTKRLQNEIFDSFIKYESLKDREHCILYQEYVYGEEYGVEILNDLNCNYVTSFAKKKIAMRAGETDIAETVNPEEFEKISQLIGNNLHHMALLDIDCIKTINNSILVIDMNCRFGGQYPFTHNAGVNIPKQIVAWLYGNPTSNKYLSQKIGIRSCKELVPTLF